MVFLSIIESKVVIICFIVALLLYTLFFNDNQNQNKDDEEG